MDAPSSSLELNVSAVQQSKWKDPKLFFPLLTLLGFILLPLISPSFMALDLATKIMIFGVLAASFDVLIGYTGIVSFAHSMFFGFGAYSVALLLRAFPGQPELAIALAFVISTGLCLIFAAIISVFSLRIKAIFYAMVTLAFTEFSIIFAISYSGITGGEDGLNVLLPSYLESDGSLLGMNGQYALYYFIVIFSALLLWGILRFIDSPVGWVLKSIRGNAPRSSALGYKVFQYQMFSTLLACTIAGYAGIFYALWIGHVSPESSLGMAVMLDILLMVMIGGVGTIYGPFIGAAILKLAQSGLPALKDMVNDYYAHSSNWISMVLERWLVLFGLIFILIVYYFPQGIVGTLHQRIKKKK